MRLHKSVYGCIITLFICYAFLIYHTLVQSPTSSTLEDPQQFNEHHFAEDRRQGILYHHKGHAGLDPRFLQFTSAPETAKVRAARVALEPLEREWKMWSDTGVSGNTLTWQLAAQWIDKHNTFHPNLAPEINGLLERMSRDGIIKADISKVTELGQLASLTLWLNGNQSFIFVPKFYDIDYTVFGDASTVRDRHNSHIVAFHLSRILSFNKVPLSVGRKLNLTTELIPVASQDLKQYLFNHNSRHCISLECPGCSSPSRSVCSDISGSMDGVLILNPLTDKNPPIWENPWKNPHSNMDNKSTKMRDCALDLSNSKSLLLLKDLIDATIIAFISGTPQHRIHNHRHHMYTTPGKDALFLTDNGSGLNNPFEDMQELLVHLKQCCRIPRTTLTQLQRFSGGLLSHALLLRLSRDPLSPLLSSLTLKAIDRRLESLLLVIQRCISVHGSGQVLI